MRELDFQKWLTEHNPKDEMLWKESYWKAYVFWRDKILPMFSDEFYKEHYKIDNIYNEINHNTQIVGEHWSKSILNPVVKITYHDVIIVFRYNYYDYEVAVISNKPINIPMNKLFISKGASFFYQGFPDEYKVKERYEDNKCRFIASIDNHYQFYTFMYLLQREIYFNSRRKI